MVVSLSQQLAGLQRGGGATQQLTSSMQGLGSTLGQIGGQLSGLGGAAGSVAGSLGQLAGSFGTLGGIGAAIGLGKVAVDLSVAGANADLLRERFDGLAVAAGTTGDALITALRSASGGEISDLNLTLAANKAQLLGVADSAEEFGVLMGIARDRAQQMGISTTQAFNDLTTGLGRGSALILDNLGIIVSVKEANETYAASLGKTAAALTEAEQKQALINQVLAQGRASLEATGGAVQSQAGTYAQFGANVENAKNSIGSFLSGSLAPLADQWNQTASATTAATGAIAAFFQGLRPEEIAAAAAGMDAYRNAIQHGATEADAQAAKVAAMAAAMQSAATVVVAAAGAYDANRAAVLSNATAHDTARAMIAGLTAEMGGNAQAAVLAAAQQAAQSQATANLTAQTTAAVSAFLSLNPSIDGAGIAAAVAAGKIPALIGQLAAMRVAAYSARDAVAALAAQQAINTKVLAVGGTNAPGRASGRNNDVDAVLELQTANKAAADARAAQIVAIGSDQAKVNELERQYGAAVKASGVGSAAAIQAETRLKQARIEAAKTKAGRAGGGAKLSDQQKLNNTLLADQESADAKFEDAESEHQDRLLKIQMDFAKKSLAQQKLNEVSKRQSQADFYDALTSSDLNKKKGGTDALKQIDADYQAAYQKSQQLAQAGNAKLAADYLALKSKQAADELSYQESLAKAKEEKDKAEVARLESIHKLRQDAAAEEEKQLLAGGDANVTAKQDALDEEAAKNQEAQDKIGTAAERAADRKALAAERNGKAIDAEQLKLDKLKSTYDQILPSSTTTTPGASTPTSASAAAIPAAATGGDALAAALEGLRAAIAAVEGATRAGADKVAGAVSRAAGGKLAS